LLECYRQAKLKYYEKTVPGATLSATDPTWTGLGSNLAYMVTGQEVITQAKAQRVIKVVCSWFKA